MVDCVQFETSNKTRSLDKRYLKTQARIDSLIRPIGSYTVNPGPSRRGKRNAGAPHIPTKRRYSITISWPRVLACWSGIPSPGAPLHYSIPGCMRGGPLECQGRINTYKIESLQRTTKVVWVSLTMTPFRDKAWFRTRILARRDCRALGPSSFPPSRSLS